MVHHSTRILAVPVLFAAALVAYLAWPVRAEDKAPKTHLFILSGQSNMAGLNPDLSFTPTVTKALAPEKVIVVKDAMGGQPIRRWYKKWHAPKGKDIKPGKAPWGDLYDRMMKKVNAAVGETRPDTVTFVWMQGERDAKESLADVYSESFRGIIDQLRADLKRDDIHAVIGRISDFDMKDGRYPHWTKIRDIHVKLAETDPRTEWVDTDDLNGEKDGLHYTKEGYVELGKRFAEKALGLANSGDKGGKAAAAGASEPWFFIVAADPQLSGKEIDEKNWEKGIAHINRLKPELLVVCGDLTFGGNKSEDRVKPEVMARDDKLAAAYNRITARLDKSIQLYNIAGNHDVGVNPCPETIAWFTKKFGKPWQAVEHKGTLLVMIESDILRDGSAGPKLAAEQLAWLKKTLTDAKVKGYAHRMVFQHHPLYLKSADEKDAYQTMPKPRRKELLAMYHDAGIEFVFAGHTHKNIHVKDGRMEMLTTTVAALGESKKANPHGVRIVKVYPDRIEQKFYAYEDLPEKVTLETK